MKTEAGNRNSSRRRQQQSEAELVKLTTGRLRLAGGTMEGEGSKLAEPSSNSPDALHKEAVAGKGLHLSRTVLTPRNQSSAV